MDGDTVKKKIKGAGASVSGVAKMLGTSQQNLNQQLNSSDVKTGLVEKISEALGLPLSYFYEKENGQVHTHGDYSPASINGNIAVNVSHDKEAAPIGSLLTCLAQMVAKQESALADTKSLRADFISAIAELNQATAQNKILLTRLARFLDTEAQNYGLAADSLPQNSIKKVD